MRRLACSLGILMVSALAVDCGPGAPPLSGTLLYGEGCRQVMDPADPHPPCDTTTHNPSGAAGTGDPPLTVSCAVQLGDGGPSRVRFTLVQGGFTGGTGITVCGSVPTVPGELQGATGLYFAGGEHVTGIATPGLCHVKFNTIGTDSFSGQIQCADVPGPATPTKLHFIQGIPSLNGQGGTVDPAWGDFNFTSCTVSAAVTCS